MQNQLNSFETSKKLQTSPTKTQVDYNKSDKKTIEITSSELNNYPIVKKSVSIKKSTNKNYPDILRKNNMKVTKERLLNDFRDTMREIVNVKNGRQKADGSRN